MKNLWLVLIVALQCGCATQAHLPLAEETFILLMDMPSQESTILPGTSSRAYHRTGGRWDLPVALRDQVRRIVRQYDLDVVDIWPLAMIGELCVVIRSHPAELELLRKDSRISGIQEVNYFDVLTEAAYDDPEFRLQFGDQAEQLRQLHSWSTGEGVTVGMIDTVVSLDHEDLRGQVASQTVFVEDDPDELDQLHGTAVAGVIAANPNNGRGIVGLAPGIRLRSYVACYYRDAWKRTVCDTFALAKALEAAHDDHVSVLNLSLSGPQDLLVETLISRLVRDGTVVVAADDPALEQRAFPARLPDVIAATSPSESRSFRPRAVRASDEQLSTKPGNGYQFFYGTSMSSAGVTALTALLLSRYSLGYSEARERLATLEERCGNADTTGECSMRFALAIHHPDFNARL